MTAWSWLEGIGVEYAGPAEGAVYAFSTGAYAQPRMAGMVVAEEDFTHRRMGARMQKLNSILVVLDRRGSPRHVLAKAMVLARHFHAKVELFLCDSEHAYALRHAYDASGVQRAREACLTAEDVPISTYAACESPLYEGIVQRVLESCPDLVIKEAGGEDRGGRSSFDANDWQLARTCPVPVMLTRGRPWQPQPRFAAALDFSEQETPGLAAAIAGASEYLAAGCDAELALIYSERGDGDRRGCDERVGKLNRAADEVHVPRTRVHVLEGEPETTLPGFAGSQDYDLLILGALSHRKGIADLVGTLTSTLVDALDCDLVLVKPGAYSCPVSRPVQAAAG
jgi:universal stress protein E